MAKVKITGHASGTGILTVTAPNTSTDRTITLPDATGTLLNSDGSGASLTALNATQLTSGTVPTARLGSGTASSGTILYGDQTYKAAPTSFDPDGAQVFNETGADVDFRIEADANTYTFFVDGSTGHVGISDTYSTATETPHHALTVNTDNDGIFINNTGTTNGEFAKLMFGSHDVAAAHIKQAIVVKRNGDFGVGDMQFWVDSNADNASAVEADAKLTITQAGLGLSQFTAKAWISYNHQTPTIKDSHNISSVTDSGTGEGIIYIDVDTASGNTACTIAAGKGPGSFSASNFSHCGLSEGNAAASWWFGTIKNDALFDSANVNGVCFGD